MIVSLPSDTWKISLNSLAEPIINCLSAVTKEADQSTTPNLDARARQNSIMIRLSNEISLLAAVVRFFIEACGSKNVPDESKEAIISNHRSALVSLLQKSWPCITHMG